MQKIAYAPLIHVCTELQTKLFSLNFVCSNNVIQMNQMIIPNDNTVERMANESMFSTTLWLSAESNRQIE